MYKPSPRACEGSRVGKILIVDDEAIASRALSKLLSHAGHDAVCVGDANHALNYLNAMRADLVVLDVMMPGMSGIELLRLMRDHPNLAGQRVVMWSADDNPATVSEARRLGAVGFLVKAKVQWPELRKHIDACLSAPAESSAAGLWDTTR